MNTSRLEAVLIGVGAALAVAGIVAYFRPDPQPPAEQQIGAGKEIQKIAAPIVKVETIKYKTDTLVLGKLELSYAGIRGAMREDLEAGRPFDTLKAKPALETGDSIVTQERAARAASDRRADALFELNRGMELELVGTRRERDDAEARARRGKIRTIVVGVGSFVAGVGTDRIISAVRKPP